MDSQHSRQHGNDPPTVPSPVPTNKGPSTPSQHPKRSPSPDRSSTSSQAQPEASRHAQSTPDSGSRTKRRLAKQLPPRAELTKEPQELKPQPTPRGLQILLGSVGEKSHPEKSLPSLGAKNPSPHSAASSTFETDGERARPTESNSSNRNTLVNRDSQITNASSDCSASRFPLPPTSAFTPSSLSPPETSESRELPHPSAPDTAFDGRKLPEGGVTSDQRSYFDLIHSPRASERPDNRRGAAWPRQHSHHISNRSSSGFFDMAWPPNAPLFRDPPYDDTILKNEKYTTPPRAIFEDLPTAHSSITSRSASTPRSKPTSPHSLQEDDLSNLAGSSDPKAKPTTVADLPFSSTSTISWVEGPGSGPPESSAGAPSTSQHGINPDLALSSTASEPSATATAVPSTYLRPFNRIGQAVRSLPQLSAEIKHGDNHGNRVSHSADQIQWNDLSDSESQGLSFGRSPLPSATEDDARGLGTRSVSPAVTKDVAPENGREHEHEKDHQQRSIIRSSGFSNFDFELDGREDGTGPESAGWSSIHSPGRGTHGQFPGLATKPPTSPLPPIPSHFGRTLSSDSRDLSLSSEVFSVSTSYGDTRNLLDLSQPLPPGLINDRPLGGIESHGSQSPGNASSGVLGTAGSSDWNLGQESDFEALPPNLSARPRGIMTSDSVKLDHGSHKNLSNLSSQRVSRSSSANPRDALESEIARDLRRVSQMSGISNLSGSVVVMNENGIQALKRLSRQGTDSEPGHGGFQSSSSRDLSCGNDDQAPDDSGHSDIDPSSSDDDTTSRTTWKGNRKGIVVGKKRSEQEKFGDDFADEEDDGDWETVAESGAISRYETGRNLARAITGSSLANFSSFASLSPEDRRDDNSLGSIKTTGEVIQHPGDARFDFAYRLRQVTPGQTPVLLPSYNYPGGSNFPNRNALTPPLPSELNSKNPYRHPSPLSNGHVHPFKSSPPTIESAPPEAHPHTPERGSFDYNTAKRRISQDYLPIVEYESSESRGLGLPDLVLPGLVDSGNLDDSYSSFRRLSSDGGSKRNDHESQSLPGPNGSFSKMIRLGPKVNVTGTPEGTGMHEVGSSLADASSPSAKWSSNSSRFRSSPVVRLEPLPEIRSPLPSPQPALLRGSPLTSDFPNSPEMDSHIKAHRDVLRREGLLPVSEPPPPSRHGSRPQDHGSADRIEPVPSPALFEDDRSVPAAAYRQPFRPLSPRDDSPYSRSPELEGAASTYYRLYQHPREASSIATDTRGDKRKISRGVLAVCLLFPPLLLLYGYGVLDIVMVELSHGGIRRFGKAEKKFALLAGWGIATAAIIGIVVSMIVVGAGGSG
ncbi:MAG: hypothetical protein M1837_001520 [Sclerophora amabilis]|nr:MAG: hypothetical protein M1837_001520 [Sclerophora amabilis]